MIKSLSNQLMKINSFFGTSSPTVTVKLKESNNGHHNDVGSVWIIDFSR